MSYREKIDGILRPFEDPRLSLTVIDLFAGCGGLSLGFEAQGFKTIGYEKNPEACKTYNLNLNGVCYHEELSAETNYAVKPDILIGGPPCQPFSAFGRKLGLKDSRDGFPIFIAAVRKIKPSVFLFENVRGLLFKRNKWYFEQIVENLEELGYCIEYRVLNAKNFDVPQNRERLFVIGYKGTGYCFPTKRNYLITAGEALGDLVNHMPENWQFLTESMDEYIAKYEKASCCITPRDLHMDKPARTLTCRNIAAATSDMHRIKLPDGRRRRLTPKETSILQSFPDWFTFEGNENSIFYQIGNAVPPMLAYHLAGSIKHYLQTPIYSTGKSKNKFKRQVKQLMLFS